MAGQALTFSGAARNSRPALVNGGPGLVVFANGLPFAVIGCTVVGGKIVEMVVLADPERLSKLDLAALDD